MSRMNGFETDSALYTVMGVLLANEMIPVFFSLKNHIPDNHINQVTY